jgi:hypothetical protein
VGASVSCVHAVACSRQLMPDPTPTPTVVPQAHRAMDALSTPGPAYCTVEHARMRDSKNAPPEKNWRRWGTYVSDRQWGTVREDYSGDGEAWESFPFDHARSRAYRWGEDGIGGWCDDAQDLSITVAFWNGKDPFLKERFFGLTNHEGNHGEDVKELYWFLDGTPTGSYARMLYKYPQAEFPYQKLRDENKRRTRQDREYEILDTGIFNESRYWDCEIEWAKSGPEDHLLRITVHNRGPEEAVIHVLPQAIFTNTWSWLENGELPAMAADGPARVTMQCRNIGGWRLDFERPDELLFTDNETNVELLHGKPRDGKFFKDGINDAVVQGMRAAVNPARTGTKMAAVHVLRVPPGQSRTIRARLQKADPARVDMPQESGAFADFDQVFEQRRKEADEFYGHYQSEVPDADDRLIQRQAWAGLHWCKQSYHYGVRRWLRGDGPMQPTPPAERLTARNSHWKHYWCHNVFSMPDSWEYPWFASWDLGFHAVAFADVDPEFAKQQLLLLCQDFSMHPSGALPAYEWNFGDVNPPVQAWAALRVFEIEALRTGRPDFEFLKSMFFRLALNFEWWVNRKDADGNNIFEGGFLGLDNVGVFDRGHKFAAGTTLQQSDATSWMAMFCLNMLRIGVIISQQDKGYEDACSKFFTHFLSIAHAMSDECATGQGLWDEADTFFYDHLRMPDGTVTPLRVQSIVGLMPLLAVHVLTQELIDGLPMFERHLNWLFVQQPELANLVSRWREAGTSDTHLFALLRGFRTTALLRHALDEREFLSPYGIRSLSRVHRDKPFHFKLDGQEMVADYEPAESNSGAYGGNSNWRGPIWMPMNYLLIESLQRFYVYYGDDFKVEMPVGSGQMVTLSDVGAHLRERLLALFRKDKNGCRPCMNDGHPMWNDPHFKDLIWFSEYFDGDNGRGCGASHQTGWTALVARLFFEKRFRLATMCPDGTEVVEIVRYLGV